MKKNTHPKEYREVVFVDSGTGDQFLTRSTVKTTETALYKENGKEYPAFFVEVSSATHPFFTGQEKVMDTAGRVDKFKKRASLASAKKA
jgi:large subunit ribosomal protein L31